MTCANTARALVGRVEYHVQVLFNPHQHDEEEDAERQQNNDYKGEEKPFNVFFIAILPERQSTQAGAASHPAPGLQIWLGFSFDYFK